ncbi:MAG TPA: transcriptional regulator [Candidatus Saccharimonadales bacterium]|nr:transcriptional regulator [Candidatus Saccharimonadales bacterium]
MIEQLFGSKTRVKLLQLFYGNPNRSFYVREITRKIDEQINSVRRELANLLSIGIITSDTVDSNRLYYEVNQKFEYYTPLLAMFGGKPMIAVAAEPNAETGKKKSIPQAAAPEPAELKALGNVELALYTGQFTRDDSSGIDLLIVGSVNPNKLHKFVSELESKENKELRYALFSLEEYKYRDQIKDRFVTTIKSSKKQVLFDKQHLLG